MENQDLTPWEIYPSGVRTIRSIALVSLLVPFTALAGETPSVKPPVAKRIPKVTEIHGEKLVDDWFWLREKQNPEVKAYIDAENAYADAVIRVPWGAHPFASPGCYRVDEAFIRQYVDVANRARKGDRSAFDAWLQRYVHGPKSQADYLGTVGFDAWHDLQDVTEKES